MIKIFRIGWKCPICHKADCTSEEHAQEWLEMITW